MSLLSSIPHFLLATILCVAGLFDEAITQYRKLVSLDPRNAQSRLLLADAYAYPGAENRSHRCVMRGALSVAAAVCTFRQFAARAS